MQKIVELGLVRENMTVADALAVSSREALKGVVVLGRTESDCFVIRASSIPSDRALWLLELGRMHVMGTMRDDL